MEYENWNRPRLPIGHDSVWGRSLSVILFIAGLGGIVVGLSTATSYARPDPTGVAVAYAGASALCLGLLVAGISALIREVRQVAFEAAIRAGEVEPAKASAAQQVDSAGV